MTTDRKVDTAALRNGQVVAILGLRDTVIVAGPEAEAFLQGQMSQDIVAMAVGESRWSLLLQPQGKIDAWLRITRTGDERYLVDVDAGWADKVVARLNRFKLRTRCEIEVPEFGSCTVLGGELEQANQADRANLGAQTGVGEITGVELALADELAGVAVRVYFGPELKCMIEQGSAGLFDALRAEGGRPAMGVELDESTIPAAAGIVEQSVSFTKGCYTGQELVARVDSRGNNVPRRLVGLAFDGDIGDHVEPGSVLRLDGDEVGQVTTLAYSSLLGSDVGLAYARRTVEIGATIEVGGRAATVKPLPLVAG